MQPSEAAFWNKSNTKESEPLVTEQVARSKKNDIRSRTVQEEAYSIMTGQPKINPADPEASVDYEVDKNVKSGWFWERRKKDKKQQKILEEQQAPQEDLHQGMPSLQDALEDDSILQEEISQDSDTVYIKDIEFVGNKLIPADVLMSQLQMCPGDLYTREGVQQNLKAIYEMGYFTDKIRAIPIIHNDNFVTIRISVEENIPITGFTISGNNSLPNEELNEILMDLLYEPQNIIKMNQTIEKIQRHYAEKGYILARVTSVLDDPDGVVNIDIDEGIIKSIKVEGNKKTKDFVINRNILLEEGSAYNELLLKQDLMRLYATQAFKDVTRTIEQDKDEPNKYNITIQLEEQRTGQISLGGGVDTATGLFGTAGFGDNNFRGRGQRLQASFLAGTGTIMSDDSMLNRANWQAEISFFEPMLFGTDNSLLSRAYFRDFASYQVPLAIERRFGLENTISRQFKDYKNLTGSLSFGGEYIKVKEGDFNQIQGLYKANGIPISERAKQLEGGFFLNVAPSLTYDTRDSLIAPRNGTLATVRYDQAFSLSSFHYSHAKLTGSIKQYMPIPKTKKAALSLTAKAGSKLYGDMPEVMAYRLGGPYTVRGFKMSAIGTGDGYVMGSAELLLPLPFVDRLERLKFLDNVRVAFFADAGKIFNESISDKIYDRPLHAITTGVGLKVYVPGVGPLSIDYGFPLTNPGRSASKSGTFTFSAGDMY